MMLFVTQGAGYYQTLRSHSCLLSKAGWGFRPGCHLDPKRAVQLLPVFFL